MKNMKNSKNLVATLATLATLATILVGSISPAFAEEDDISDGDETAQVEGWTSGSAPVIPHVIVVPDDVPESEPPPSKKQPSVHIPVDGPSGGSPEPAPTEPDKK